MSRRQRLHVPEGTYYVIQHGNTHQPVFAEAEDYALFERLLASALRRTGARAHAYCWTPQTIHLVLQIGEISVGRFMQGLTSRYARSMHKRDGESGHFFRHRYKAVLIDPKEYLLRLTHYIHHVPMRTGLAENPGAYPHSSYSGYLHRAIVPWLTTRNTLRQLGGCDDVSDYAELMKSALSDEDTALFDRCGTSDMRVIGNAEFMQSLPRHSRTYRTKASLDQIIQTVTCTLGVEREHVLSSSRQRDFTLARALIAWYATERGVATLSEVARHLRRDPSTLSMAVSRYRVRRPELFKLTAIHDVVPLASLAPATSTHGWDAGMHDDEERESA